MNVLLKLPTDLFRHTMLFHNPKTKTAVIIEELLDRLQICEDGVPDCCWDIEMIKSIDYVSERFAEKVVTKEKQFDLFYKWAHAQYFE